MPQYRRKPALTEAHQWFRNGDHPRDRSVPIDRPEGSLEVLTEGQVVKRFRALHIPGDRFCPECGNIFQKHGMLEGENVKNQEEKVCPGDYIVTDRQTGKYYKMSRDTFEELFEQYPPSTE